MLAGIGQPGETANDGRRRRGRGDHRSGADDGAGHDPGADGELHVITNEGANEAQAGAMHRAMWLQTHLHLAVGIQQVGVGCAGSEVDPLADPRITQVSVVRLVGVALEDGAADLATDLAHRPNHRIGLDQGAINNRRVAADRARPADHRPGANDGPLVNHDRPVLGIEHDVRIQSRGFVDLNRMLSDDDGLVGGDLRINEAN